MFSNAASNSVPDSHELGTVIGGGASISYSSLVISSSSSSSSSSSFSSTESQSKKPRPPMDRNEEISYFERLIRDKEDEKNNLSSRISSATEMKNEILQKKEMTDNEADRLKEIQEVDLPYMKINEVSLVAEIAMYVTTLNELRNPKEQGGALVPIQDDIDSFLSILDLLPPSQSRSIAISSSTFPLLLQRESIISAIKALLYNCSEEAVEGRDKESRCLPMTSAPTGSGKTIFLRILFELFRHKWDIGSFMKEHVYPQKCGKELEESIIKTITSILSDPEIEELKNATDLSSSLFLSTYPCFISFGSGTPTNRFELENFKNNPTGILISRVIFEQTNHKEGSWETEYNKFYETHLETLKKLHDLPEVLSYFRKRNGCEHFFLAIDELLHLDPALEGVESSNVEVVVKSVGSAVITTDGIHAIISSLVTDPLIKYVGSTQHTPHFVRLYPLLENLYLLSAHIDEQRHDSNNVGSILQLLNTTGGHPKIIRDLIPWLLKVPKGDMTLENAAKYIKNKIFMYTQSSEPLHSKPLQQLVYIGGCVPSKDNGAICGSSGMLSRPNSIYSAYLAIVPPLVLYTLGLKDFRTFAHVDLNDLVPLCISSSEIFKKFIACWFALQIRLHRPLHSLFDNYDKESSFTYCAQLFELSKQSHLFEFRNLSVFMSSLPNTESTFVRMKLSTTGNISNLFGLSVLSEGYRVWVIENQSNPGFDIMISYSTLSEVTKKVLLIQCKTDLVIEGAGEGQTVDTKSFFESLVNCSEIVSSLEGQGWEVSFLGIYSCKATRNVIPEVCPAGVSPTFFERCAVIGNTGTFNLLGDTFGLALELAKGYTFKEKY